MLQEAMVQALGSVLILALPVGNVVKLGLFLAFWAVTFRRLSRKEAAVTLGICALFTLLDWSATQHGVFYFIHSDISTLAAYAPVFYGFLFLHTLRLLKGPLPPTKTQGWIYLFAIVFALPYMIFTQAMLLFWVPAVFLVLMLGFFHETYDLYYVGYVIAFGVVWEYTGVWRGQWAYPHSPVGGVPSWFIPMWGGIGFFIRRLAYPWVADRYSAREPSSGPDPKPF